jgi:outer membrane immunogenic protein
VRQIANAVACATVLCAAGTSGALAQPAPVAPIYNWTGFYAGFNAGLGGGSATPAYLLSAAPDSVSHYPGAITNDSQVHRSGGGFVGAQAGYNYQFRNNVVLGIESDFQWSNIQASNRSDTATSINATTPFPINTLASANMAISQHWFGTTRLRLGYAFADRLLAYVTGGVAYSEFAASNSGLSSESTPIAIDYSHTTGAMTSTRIGWAAGAGVEYALGNNLSIRSEYLFSEYSGFTAPYLNTALAVPATISGTFSTGTLGIHLVRAGLNYKFGAPGDLPAAGNFAVHAPASPSFNWTGFYAGINGGYGAGVATPALSESSLVLLFGPSQNNTANVSDRLRASGFTAGGQLGYNWLPASKFLAGFETDLQWSDIHASSRSSSSGAYNLPALLTYFSNSSTSVGQNWFGTTRLRLGYLVSDRFLAYATGGLAYSSIRADYAASSGDNGGGSSLTTTSGARNSTRIGWTAGAGAEYAMTGNLSVKTEYLYSEYSGFAIPYQTTAATGFSSTTANGTLSSGTLGIHLVRAGLNLKLGDPGH